MKFSLLALDYDGTIAEHGVLDADVRRALVETRTRNITLVLVTGRILADLQDSGGLDLFDAVVAENGAVLHFPRTGRATLLARPPEPACVAELTRRHVPFRTGACVIELDARHAETVLAVIRDLELPLIVIFNRGRAMVLPQAVSKATGLREAARSLRVSLHNAVAIGDAENDHDMLQACEIGVAVAWGSPALQRAADEVLPGSGPPAVAEFVRRVIAQESLPATHRKPRRYLYLGLRPGGQPLALATRGRNVLIVGDPRSGKSWLAGLLCEQLILHRYCVCVIDPEGDYVALESLPGVIVLSAEGDQRSLDQAELTLRYPDVSVVVDLCRLPHDTRRSYVVALLERMTALRRRTGLPHRLVVDEAHYFLHDSELTALLDLDFGGHTLISYRASQLRPNVLASAAAVLVTRETDAAEAEALRKLVAARWSPESWAATLRELELDEAALLPAAEESGTAVVRFRIGQRLTPHVRHKRKYLEVSVSEGAAFVFMGDGWPTGQRARSLRDLINVLSAAPDHGFDPHLERGDFSRWVQDLFADAELATELRTIEGAWRTGHVDRPYARIVCAICERYLAPDPGPLAAGTEVRVTSS